MDIFGNIFFKFKGSGDGDGDGDGGATGTGRGRTTNKTSVALWVFVFSFFSVAFYTFYINPSLAVSVRSRITWLTPTSTQAEKNRITYSLNCTTTNQTQTCPKLPLIDQNYQSPSPLSCPHYFRWIHDDLQPWRETGITKEMVDGARRTANFRLTILGGKAYVETFSKAFQTRDVFTLWGILQLLKRYPGIVPDLDLMFDCNDIPVLFTKNYDKGVNATTPPPLFRYCGSEATFDIPFPDWSFWGWPEINIKPWNLLLQELQEGNKKKKWMDRIPYAYWKGNPDVAWGRKDLLTCNGQDWNAQIFPQNWQVERQKGFKQSNLAEQCTHRFKIYIEGRAWSVSEKYILACDSPSLLVTPHFYDMFTRSLVPLQHYWPIKENQKCQSIKFAVDWGNAHKKEAQEIGKSASNFIKENVSMEYVYDYMFHLLNEYAKLLKFKPSKPVKAVEICSETMACRETGLERNYMMETMVNKPSDTMPCNLPPPIDDLARLSFYTNKEVTIKQVEMWQNRPVNVNP